MLKVLARRRLFAGTLVAVVGAAAGLGAAPAQAIDVKVVKSAKGIKAWLVEDRLNPIITIRFTWRAGAAYDPKGKSGLASLLGSLLTEGAGDMNANAFQRALEDRSISISFRVRAERFNGTLVTLTRHKAEAFRLLRAAIMQPRLDADAIERERTSVLEDIRERPKNPRYLAWDRLFRDAFGDHPYARPTGGFAADVKSLTKADMLAWIRANLARNNLYIGVVGDISPQELAKVLDQVFGDLPARTNRPPLPPVKPKFTGKTTVIQFPNPQSRVVFAQTGVPRLDKDFIAAWMMNRILGAGSVSRLYIEVREKRGLVYGVWSQLSPMDKAAVYFGGAATRNKDVGETIRIIRAQWKRMAEKGVTEKELEATKKWATGSYPRRFASSNGIAGLLVVRQMQKFTPNYFKIRNKLVRAVTNADIKRVAKKLLKPGALTFVVVGRPSGKL